MVYSENPQLQLFSKVSRYIRVYRRWQDFTNVVKKGHDDERLCSRQDVTTGTEEPEKKEENEVDVQMSEHVFISVLILTVFSLNSSFSVFLCTESANGD